MRQGRKGGEVTGLVTGMLMSGKPPCTTKLKPRGSSARLEERVSERLPPGTRNIHPLSPTPLYLRLLRIRVHQGPYSPAHAKARNALAARDGLGLGRCRCMRWEAVDAWRNCSPRYTRPGRQLERTSGVAWGCTNPLSQLWHSTYFTADHVPDVGTTGNKQLHSLLLLLLAIF